MAHIPAHERREQLLDAAIEVIAEEGIRGATTRRIAEVAHAPSAAVHYCFHTKEELYLAVFERISHAFKDYASSVASAGGVGEAAAQSLQRCAEWTESHPALARANLDLALWASRRDVHGESAAARMYVIFVDDILDLLMVSADEFETRASLTPLARLIVALSDGITFQWVAHGDAERMRDAARDAGDLVRIYARALPAGTA